MRVINYVGSGLKIFLDKSNVLAFLAISSVFVLLAFLSIALFVPDNINEPSLG